MEDYSVDIINMSGSQDDGVWIEVTIYYCMKLLLLYQLPWIWVNPNKEIIVHTKVKFSSNQVIYKTDFPYSSLIYL